jgi:precorrin-6B methylase 2
VFVEGEDGAFQNNEVSDCFRDEPGSARPMALMLPRESYAAFSELGYTLETGLPAYEKVYGMPRFAHLAQDPEASELFNEAMRSGSESVAGEVAAACDLSSARTVIDVGGGTGALLAGVLLAYPGLRGAILDIPAGLRGARENLQAHGVLERTDLIEGNFFEAVPGGYDAYLLKYIVHDWDDDQAANILGHCAEGMTATARLLLVERVLPERAEPSAAARTVFLADMNMMVALGGRERTAVEYGRLLKQAGLRLGRIVPATPALSVLEAARA